MNFIFELRLQKNKYVLMAVMIMLSLALPLKAEEYTYGGVVYWIDEYSDEASALRYDGNSETVKIVDTFTYQGTTYNVSFGYDLKQSIFTNQSKIRTVDASAVQKLDPDIRFSDCQFLSTVIPSEEWEVGDYQYYNCPMLDLRTVLVPNLTEVGSYAFAMESPTNFGELLGTDISKIYSSTSMENRLYSVIELKKALGDATFHNLDYLDLSELTSFILDGYEASDFFTNIEDAPKFKSLTVLNGSLDFGFNPPAIENVTLGGVITQLSIQWCDISATTFHYDDLEVVEELVLMGDESVTNLDLKGKVGRLKISDLSKLETLSGCEGVTYAAIVNCKLLEKISLPDIEELYSVGECTNLKEIYLGESLRNMNQEMIFYDCNNLEDFIFGGSIEQWLAVKRDNAEENHPKDAPLSKVKNFWYGHGNAKMTMLTELNVGNIGNATEIGPEAFTAYKGLTKIDLPSTVKVIGASSFAECSNLKSVKINAERIDQYAFYGVDGIEDFIIGSELEYIGPAFSEMNNPVTVVNYLSDPGNWAKIERTNIVYLDPYDPEVGVGNIVRGTYMIPAKEMLFMGQPLVTLELDAPEIIAPGAFANIKDLTNLKINQQSGITTFGEKSFFGCSSLKTIEINSAVASRAGDTGTEGYIIDSQAFYGCAALEDIPMLDNLKSIASDALNETGWIKKQPANSVIYLNTEYGRTAFTYNGIPSENSRLEIEDATLAINDGAFALSDFANFTSVSLPLSLKYIGAEAFNGTHLRGELTIPASVEVMKSNNFNSDIDCVRFEDSDMPLEIEQCNFNSIGSIYYGRNFTETSRRIYIKPAGASSFEKAEYGKNVTEINSANNIPIYTYYMNCIYSYSTVPPVCEDGINGDKENCKLYVPEESLETYRSADVWGQFKNILPIDKTGIDDVIIDNNSVSRHYDISGRPIQESAKGIHIIVKADGSTQKIIVK